MGSHGSFQSWLQRMGKLKDDAINAPEEDADSPAAAANESEDAAARKRPKGALGQLCSYHAKFGELLAETEGSSASSLGPWAMRAQRAGQMQMQGPDTEFTIFKTMQVGDELTMELAE